MSFYRNAAGAVAKVMRTGCRVVVMAGCRTMFFGDMAAARAFLADHGYY